MPGRVGPGWQSARAGLARRDGSGVRTWTAAARPSARPATPTTVLRTTEEIVHHGERPGQRALRGRMRGLGTTREPRRRFAGHFAPGLNENFAVAVALAPLPIWTVTVRVPSVGCQASS